MNNAEQKPLDIHLGLRSQRKPVHSLTMSIIGNRTSCRASMRGFEKTVDGGFINEDSLVNSAQYGILIGQIRNQVADLERL